MCSDDQPTEEFDLAPAARVAGAAVTRDLQRAAWRGSLRETCQRAHNPDLVKTSVFRRPPPAPTVHAERTWSFDEDSGAVVRGEPPAAPSRPASPAPARLSEEQRVVLVLLGAAVLGGVAGTLMTWACLVWG
jgi:hypothetical protein